MGCTNLTNVTIPNSVGEIGNYAFSDGTGLSSTILPVSVTNIGDYAFSGCTNLTGVCFQGDAPTLDVHAFTGAPATIYYLPGTGGWGPTFAGLPTAPWILPGAQKLAIVLSGANVVLTWPTNAAGFTLQSTTNLIPSAVWSRVPSTPTIVSGQITVINSISGGGGSIGWRNS